eukprot:m.61940 g.61940  ORF g.61940 m.61940 type:complete len:736 (+) comp23061_c0_seq2:155-2362(+)
MKTTSNTNNMRIDMSLLLVMVLQMLSGEGSAEIPPCRDVHSDCDQWKSGGYCEHVGYQDFMDEYCRKSCDLCKEVVKEDGESASRGACIELPRSDCEPISGFPCCFGMSCVAKSTSFGENSHRCLVDDPVLGSCYSVRQQCSRNKQCCTGICDKDSFVCIDATEYKATCADLESKQNCEFWQVLGHCTSETNKENMRENCAMTCGICDTLTFPPSTGPTATPSMQPTRCADTDGRCTFWKNTGYCLDNTAYMEKTCPNACGWCGTSSQTTPPTQVGGGCKNRNANCDVWQQQGDCESRFDYMREVCPLSCDLCIPSSPPSQVLQAVQVSSLAPSSKQNTFAPTSSLPCVDLRSDCPKWAKIGHCYGGTWKTFMSQNCPAACYLCTPSDTAVVSTTAAPSVASSPPETITTNTGAEFKEQIDKLKSCNALDTRTHAPRHKIQRDKLQVQDCANLCDAQALSCIAFVFRQEDYTCLMFRSCRPVKMATSLRTFLQQTSLQKFDSEQTTSSSPTFTAKTKDVKLSAVNGESPTEMVPSSKNSSLSYITTAVIILVVTAMLIVANVIMWRALKRKRNQDQDCTIAYTDVDSIHPVSNDNLETRKKTTWDQSTGTGEEVDSRLRNPLYKSINSSVDSESEGRGHRSSLVIDDTASVIKQATTGAGAQAPTKPPSRPPPNAPIHAPTHPPIHPRTNSLGKPPTRLPPAPPGWSRVDQEGYIVVSPEIEGSETITDSTSENE